MFLWGEEVADKLVGAGFERLKGCGQVYYHEKMKFIAMVHGDDFVCRD